ncbi:tyrosine-type recombinase/integrase [Effusibacillus lacus]|uniref:Integrase n=1 Tax=Effusibacillus lacus TaxID=1348429 RepID=A0A292YGX3_9BACL|nr:tyrosine-type recombinase/integrase [Effusibacillus lacus]TCS71388.1 integrase/recombinase XerD [Effusibacillus lacus]GAX89917.1 integrase [Effusibacillus lacus]
MFPKTHRKLKRSNISTERFHEGLTIIEAFQQFIRVKEIEGLAPRTLDDHRTFFRYFLEWLGQDAFIREIDITIIRDYIHYMLHEKGLSNMTINVRIRPLKAFLRFCYKEGMLEFPLHEQIKILKVEEDKIESLTIEEIKRLLDQIDTSTYVGLRDYTMICLLLETGIRINELLHMKVNHVNFRTLLIDIPAENAKSRKYRQIPITKKIARLLAELMDENTDFDTDYVFVSYEGKPFTVGHWRRKLAEYGKKAGITSKRVSPHTFRHTFALLYILNGGDPFSLQRILGHSSMYMVRKYIHMAPGDIKSQHEKYSPFSRIKI